MKKADLYFTLFLLALSAFTFVEGLGYPYEFRGGLGSGFFPVWISVLLFVLSLINALKILRSLKKEDKRFFVSKTHRDRVALFLLSLLVYVVAITYLGILSATLLYALFVYKIFDGFTWKSTLPPAIGLVVFIYVTFHLVLGLRLPAGFLI